LAGCSCAAGALPKTGFPVEVTLGPVQRATYDRAEQKGRVWLNSLGTEITISHVLELIPAQVYRVNSAEEMRRLVARSAEIRAIGTRH